jgi:hypothetical protein
MKRLIAYGHAVRSASGGYPLRTSQAVLSVAYARIGYRIGPLFHSLFRLAEVPREEWSEIVLDRELNPALLALNRAEHRVLATDKLAFTAHCVAQGLPTIPVLCILGPAAGAAAPGVPRATGPEALARALDAAPARVFAKHIDGAHGDDAFAATRCRGGWRWRGRTGSAADLYRFCMERIGERRGWMFQPAVGPHPELDPIMPGGALGTVRAVTYLAGGDVTILPPVLRIPANGNTTDNFGVGTNRNVVAPVDMATGTLGRGLISRSATWPAMTDVDFHPDTGAPIRGRTLPCWPDVVELVREAQQRTPQLPTLGWDIAITAEGPIIVEANTNYGFDVVQAAHRRGMRRELAPLFELAQAGAVPCV